MGIRAKQSQFVKGEVSAKSPAGNGLGEAATGCGDTKTKPIRGIEIAASACGLLAMTCARQGPAIRALPGAGGQQRCKTKPICREPSES